MERTLDLYYELSVPILSSLMNDSEEEVRLEAYRLLTTLSIEKEDFEFPNNYKIQALANIKHFILKMIKNEEYSTVVSHLTELIEFFGSMTSEKSQIIEFIDSLMS